MARIIGRFNMGRFNMGLFDSNFGILGASQAKPRQSTINAKWVGDKLVDVNGKVIMQAPSIGEAAQSINSFMPITGDIQSGLLAASDVKKGDYGSAALNGLGLLPFIPSMAGIVSPKIAKMIDMPVSLPNSDDFLSAVKGTKGAEITPDGLKMNLIRFQKPEQELEQSVRNGVFYLPEGNANIKHYKNKGTLATGNPYGGNQEISGETLYKNPLFVKGATGGKAPEEAYKQLMGKDKFLEMTKEVIRASSAPRHMKEEVVYRFLEDYAPELADNTWHIVQNSNQGNQLRYALQEAVIGNTARQKGYDGILGYSKGKGDKGNFLSEAFDLRESHYPSPDGTSYLNDYFKNLLK